VEQVRIINPVEIMKPFSSTLLALALVGSGTFAAERPAAVDDRYRNAIEVIRRGDLPAIQSLLADRSVLDLRNEAETPLMMYAALYLNQDGLALFLRAGADPNATNRAGASALHWAATDLAKVRALLRHGAKANVASRAGHTPLFVAAQRHGSAPVLRELLAHGADVNASNDEGLNALSAAARVGDLEAVRLLIDHKADINVVPVPRVPGKSRGNALMNAAIHGHLEIVEALVKAGADVNVESDQGPALSWALFTDRRDCAEFLLHHGARTDARGMALRSLRSDAGYTPLMYAAMTELDDPAMVEALVAKGVEVNARTTKGETALEFARKRGETSVVAALVRAGAIDEREPAAPANMKPLWPEDRLASVDQGMVRKAVESALAAQLASGVRYTGETANRCSSCHTQSLPAVALRMARERGFAFDAAVAESQVKDTLRAAKVRATQRLEIDFVSPLIGSMYLLGVDAAGHPADLLTDEYALALSRSQARDGRWLNSVARPPSLYSDVTTTAFALRAVKTYAPPTKKDEIADQVRRAAEWLRKATPTSTEERVSQLLGLHWAGVSPAQIETFAKVLAREQRSDGGWGQLATLPSDAYATGQSLYVLNLTGHLPASAASFQKGMRFLLQTQHHDGTWFVPTRAFPLQRRMDEVFPHGEHQWSSILGTTWASMALMCSVPPREELAAISRVGTSR
jgi:ankyrin repeat protein